MRPKYNNIPLSRNKTLWQLAIENLTGKPAGTIIPPARRLYSLPYQGVFISTRVIAYNEAEASVALLNPDSGIMVRGVYVEVETAFDGTPALDIGDGDNAQGYLTLNTSALAKTGWYGHDRQYVGEHLVKDGVSRNKIYSSDDIFPIASFTAGSATVGSATVYVEYIKLKG